MEILTFLLVVTLLIIILINNASIKGRIDAISRDILQLRQQLLSDEKKTIKKEVVEKQPQVQASPTPVAPPSVVEPVKSIPAEEIKPKLQLEEERPKVQAPPPTSEIPRFTPKPEPVKKASKPKVALDIEKFIGENLISKIGIIILVLGIGYFVKYAIDQNWINEYGRVAIGLVTGAALVVLAHKMRTGYKTFSSLLTGGGIAVFYLTITIAFQQYHLFNQTFAFIILIIITLFSVLLSLAYDKKELAIFSQLGGYAAPFMVSTGEGNYVVLFTYLLILNSGLIALAYFKRWNILNIIAFGFTLILFSGWLTRTFYYKTDPPYMGALVFASLFYLVFFLVNVLNNFKKRQTLNALEIGMILSNNLFYLLSGLVILNHFHEGAFKGLFTTLIGIYNLAWVFVLYKNKQLDKNLVFLLIGLVMSYISLAIPIQLNGHSITLFWTAELVILLWISQMSGIRLLKLGHLVIAVLVLISLSMDWVKGYSDYTEALSLILNRIFITGVVAALGFGIARFLLTKEKDEYFINQFIPVKNYKNVLSFAIIALVYLVILLEMQYQLNRNMDIFAYRHTVYGVYHMIFAFTLLLFLKKNLNYLQILFYGTWGLLMVYLLFYNTITIQLRDSYFFNNNVSVVKFCFHYLGFPFFIGMLLYLSKIRKQSFPLDKNLSVVFPWFLAIFTVVICSTELDNLVLMAGSTTPDSTFHLLRMNHRVGYPILWGIIAFIIMLWGLKQKQKDYRIISLSLFSLILLKLFLWDVWKMNEGGRIASFIFLGLLLLIVSFLYQKLKKLILEEEINKEPKTEN